MHTYIAGPVVSSGHAIDDMHAYIHTSIGNTYIH